MNLKKTFLLLFIIPLLSFSVHKYYLSLTQIEFNEESKSVQIIMNVFIDDIEVALNKEYGIDAKLTSKNEVVNIDTYFKKYIDNHLTISINNQPKDYTFIGKEYDGNIVYFYLEIEDISEIKSIKIQNKILINYFSEQQNLIKSKIYNKHQSLLLTKANDKGLLNF